MIQKSTMYQAVCDGCKRILENKVFEEYDSVFDTEDDALYAAIENGWQEIDGKLYCPSCIEYDEDTDGYKPKMEKN